MRVIVVDQPGQMSVRHVTEPQMGEYEARCQMLYGSICAGTDLHIVDGEFQLVPVDYPSIIGHESVGRVIEVGSKVKNFKVGDLITRVSTRETDQLALSWGGMCEYGLARDHEAMKADGIDAVEWEPFRINKVIPEGVIEPYYAPMFITWRETLSYTKRIGVGNGAKVFISGSGANGLSIAAMAVLLGAKEVVVAGSASRRKMANQVGVARYLDYRDEGEITAFIQSNPRKFDFIIDATGKKRSMNKYLGCLKHNGTFGVYGVDDFQDYQINPLLAGTFRFYNEPYDEAETHEQIVEYVRTGKLDPKVLISNEQSFTWDNALEAYDYIREKKAVKVVIKLSGD